MDRGFPTVSESFGPGSVSDRQARVLVNTVLVLEDEVRRCATA